MIHTTRRRRWSPCRQPAGRQRADPWRGLGTTGSGGPEEAMNWHRRLVALFVMLALAACAQEGQVPYAPYPPHDRSGEGVGAM
jgi:hypothetical protein